MDERDKEIQELRRENERLRKEIARLKTVQFELFKRVPADRIIELMRETPETKQ
jgi:ribosomal protein L29